ncbi:DDE_3 domain-containing protein, partial [Trichonephila clavipes]
HVRLFRGAVGDKFVCMDDNATCHRTLAVQDSLDSDCIQRLVWPSRSPDLSPIENVWGALGRQVAGRNILRQTENTLIRALTEEWDKLPQQLLDNVGAKWLQAVDGSAELSCFVPTDELSCFVPADELSCFVHTTELSRFVPAVEVELFVPAAELSNNASRFSSVYENPEVQIASGVWKHYIAL